MKEHFRTVVREALYEVVEEAVRQLCGALHHPEPQAEYRRAGSANSTASLDGRREALKRLRGRKQSGEGSVEVKLVNWQTATIRAILGGVRTRDVAGLGEVKVNVALGVDTAGHKKVLGYRVGGSENREVCADLLSSLAARGLTVGSDRDLLAVLDGSNALRSALLAHYPSARAQRCLVHKERNLRGYLSKRHWTELAQLFNQLRKVQGGERAEVAARDIRTFLHDKNAQACESFAEAGEDLLRLFHLEVPNRLHRTLLSTNAIENVFINLRRHLGRVCRWRENTDQADRWMARGLTLAQRGFRRVRGHEPCGQLTKALRRQEAQAA